VADIEKVTGFKLKLVIPKPQDLTMDPGVPEGDVTFVRESDDKVILRIYVMRGDQYVTGKKMFASASFNADVPGIGDDAYDGPAGVAVPYILTFRKGDSAATLQSSMDEPNKPLINPAQLRELARIVVSRW
jgi:hypothetical protein